MEEEKVCICRTKHKGHLCTLREKGLTREMERKTDRPCVSCGLCGEEANSEEHVCMPVPLFI